MRINLFLRARATPSKGKVFALRECCGKYCGNERIRVVFNVARNVAPNVAAGSDIGLRGALHLLFHQTFPTRSPSRSRNVASMSRRPFTNLLPVQLTSL
jgi:hypothetical protein